MGFFSAARKDAVPKLLELLKDDHVEVRRAAILSLGRIGEASPKVETDLRALTKDPDELTRVNAVIALASIGKAGDTAAPILVEALDSKEKATAKAAVVALGTLGKKSPDRVLPSMIEILKKKEGPGPEHALRVLRTMREAAKDALPAIAALYDGADAATRLDIMDAVVAIDRTGNHAIPVLIKLLKAPDPMDRKEALLGLMKYRNKADEFMDPVADLLKDRDVEVKLLAIGIVRGSGHQTPKAVDGLVELVQDPDFRVRKAAIGAVGALKPLPHEALGALDLCLKDQNASVRTITAVQLGYIGRDHPEEVTKLLEAALAAEQDERARAAITSALNRVPKTGAQRADGQQSPTEAHGSSPVR